MDIFQLIGIGITGAIMSVLLKNYRPEIAICVVLVTGIILAVYVMGMFHNVIITIESFFENCGLDQKYFELIIKIIGISYITEIGSEICKSAGEGAIALKIEIAGKLFILLLSLPIISSFLEVCTNAINLL